MDLQILMVRLEGNRLERRDIPKIRGYIASKFPQYTELHNHMENGRFVYKYPVIQYKVIDRVPCIIAINKAAHILIEILFQITEIDIKDKIMDVMEKGYYVKTYNFCLLEKLREYKFITPWMALNQSNFDKYEKGSENQKIELLKKIITGNILSMAKSLGYRVEEQINVLTKLTPAYVKFKNKNMIAFKGSFLANFMLPDYIGLGKSVSRGFGTICASKGISYM